MLSTIFILFAVIGSLASVYLMQVTWQQVGEIDPTWLRWARRMSLAAKAWALLGAANFVATTVNDEPWWPNVLLVCVVAISLIIQILIVKLRSPMFNRLAKAGLLKAK